jgi:hypothetical protein
LICLFFPQSHHLQPQQQQAVTHTTPTLQLGCTYSRNPFLSFLFYLFLFFTG